MRYYEDYVEYACDCCIHAKQTKKGWYCSCDEDDYFPSAYWSQDDEDGDSECPSYEEDPDCVGSF